jgi:hypothetical protein
MLLSSRTTAAQTSQGLSDKPAIGDSAATTLSWFAAKITLLGTLRVGYRILPHAVVIHGAPETKQRYLYLHLERPIDVIDARMAYRSVFHQYDIQVIAHDVEPTRLERSIGHRVALTGTFADPGYQPGSPDWQPFPLTMFVNAVAGRVTAAK